MPIITPVVDDVAPELPYVAGLVRAVLLSDPVFAELCNDRCATKSPADVSLPFARLDTPTGAPIDASAGAYKPLAQVTGWCAPGGAADPEVAAWNIAARATAVLCRVRNVPIDNGQVRGAWSVDRVIDGPSEMPLDTSRGESSPLYGAFVRVELVLHVS